MPRSIVLAVLVSLASCSPESDTAGRRDDAPPSPEAATAAEQAEVAGVLQRVFDALASGDEALLRSVMDEEIMMHFVEDRDGTHAAGTADLDGLAQRITTSEVRLIERMWDPEVQITGAIATVWAPYDFYAGADFSHCGIDAATLLRTDGAWKIVGLSWTREQPPQCPTHPDGPPA